MMRTLAQVAMLLEDVRVLGLLMGIVDATVIAAAFHAPTSAVKVVPRSEPSKDDPEPGY